MLSLFFLAGCSEKSDISVVKSETDDVDTVVKSEADDVVSSDDDVLGENVLNTCNTSEPEENLNSEIYVYVCGAVNEEGVYKLSSDDRVCDALDKAGGLKEDAAAGYINLAEKLSDGERIYFPTQAEVEEDRVPEMMVNGPAVSVEDNSEGGSGTDEKSGGLVNINTATRDELMTLPGIGEAKADMIISYRDEHGCFNSIEDIMNISGIKTGVYNKIKDRITVQR